jgi:hypothetical protein
MFVIIQAILPVQASTRAQKQYVNIHQGGQRLKVDLAFVEES